MKTYDNHLCRRFLHPDSATESSVTIPASQCPSVIPTAKDQSIHGLYVFRSHNFTAIAKL